MIYTAYGKECRLKLNLIFGTEYGMRAEYKEGDSWLYISEPTFPESEITTTEATDAVHQAAYDTINAKMEEMFGKDEVPESGVARIQWLMDNRTTVENNKLKLN